MRTIYIALFTILISAQGITQETWDLQRCITYAIENSIDVARADIDIEDSEIVKKMNQQARLPSLNASTNAFTNFGRTIDPTTNDFVTSAFFSNNFSINTGITIYDGGRLKNNIRQSDLDQQASQADKQTSINTVTLNVVSAYFEALFAKDNLDNAQIQVKTNQDQIDQMEKLVEAGSRAQFEIYDLEAQLATSEQQLTMAQNRVDLAMLSLKGVMNLDPNTDMTVALPPADQAVYTDLDNVQFEEIYRNVINYRSEVEAFNLRIKSGEMSVDIAKSAFLPSINFGGSITSNFSNQAKEPGALVTQNITNPVTIDGVPAILGTEQTFPGSFNNIPYFSQLDNNFSYGFGVQVNIPISNNYTAKGNVERAKLSLNRQRADMDQWIIDIRNILGQWLTDAKAAKRNLEAADKVLLARQVAYDNAQKRFDLGAINSFDYISIQDQLNTARIDQIIAKYDYMLKIKVLDFYQGFPVALK